MPSSRRFGRMQPMEPVHQVVQRGLLHYFERVCPSEHNIRIPVKALDPVEQNLDVDCLLKFELSGTFSPQAELTIRHTEGNVCEIIGALEEGPSEHFSVCVSAASPNQSLRTVGTFLLDELQRLVGARVLRHLSEMETADRAALQDVLCLSEDNDAS